MSANSTSGLGQALFNLALKRAQQPILQTPTSLEEVGLPPEEIEARAREQRGEQLLRPAVPDWQRMLETIGGGIRSFLSPMDEAGMPNVGLAGPMPVSAHLPEHIKELLRGTKVVGKGGAPRRLYHGTPTAYDVPNEGFFKSGLYGPGYYMTENPTIASGYAKKARPDRSPNVRPSFVNIRNPVDMEAVGPLQKELEKTAAEIEQQNKQYGTTENWAQDVLDWYSPVVEGSNPRPTNSEVYNDVVRVLGNPYEANDWLRARGYDGITHIGGKEKSVQHRVWIAFDPEQVIPAFSK